MKELYDEKRTSAVFCTQSTHFSAVPHAMRLCEYQRGELICSPLEPLDRFLIIISGSVTIYDITESGTTRYVSQSGRGTLLGDIEFSGESCRGFYTEALGRVTCLAIPFLENKSLLEGDAIFLRYVIGELAKKLSLSTETDIAAKTLEEKLLLHMHRLPPPGEISSVNDTIRLLHCSRRQLQRVLCALCKRGVLMHTGRGRYRLSCADRL